MLSGNPDQKRKNGAKKTGLPIQANPSRHQIRLQVNSSASGNFYTDDRMKKNRRKKLLV
jgi:hypothetical protein